MTSSMIRHLCQTRPHSLSVTWCFKAPCRRIGYALDYQISNSEPTAYGLYTDPEYDRDDVVEEFSQEKKVRRKRGRHTLTDPAWSRKVAKKLRKLINFQDPGNVIIECNPGAGVLTKALLCRSKVKVVALQYRQTTSPELQGLTANRYYKSRLHVHKGSILDIRHVIKPIESMSNMEQHLSMEPLSPVKVVGTTFPSGLLPSYINMLSYELAGRNHVYSLGRVESFLFVPASELTILGRGQHSAYQLFHQGALRSALYKILFDVKVVMPVPREAFSIKLRNNAAKEADTNIYLIRVVPQYPTLCPADGVPGLIHLLRELRKWRGKSLQHAIQCLYPDLVTAVMAGGLSKDDAVSSLSVPQLMALYKVLSSRLGNLCVDPDEDHDS